MRMTYVILAIVMTAASSYGFDLGISGGIRDWDGTSRAEERFTPQLTLTLGRTVTPNSAFRVEAIASAWTHEERDRWFDDYNMEMIDERSERSGYAFGTRVLLDNRQPAGHEHRLVRPYLGAGLHWAADKQEKSLEGRGDVGYWYDRWDAEAILGIAVPTGPNADLLIQYAISGPVDFDNPEIRHPEAQHALSLGYRFAVMR